MGQRKNPAARREPIAGAAARPAAAPLAVLCLTTLAAFWPALGNGFVNWDDGVNFVDNFNYRGLDWTHLKWMWTTFHMGHYQPLSWMTLGFDFLVWGMNPRGYHLTSLLLHCGGAVLFYLVAFELLGRALPPPREGKSDLSLPALFAALVFAVHPLRVESVAWATERRDVLSGFFYLATILLYLKACAPASARADARLLRAAAACFLLSLLSKGIAMTLPVALVLLDVYPLRRLPADPTRWSEAGARAVLLEKAPFAAAAVPFAAVAFLAQKHTGVIAHFSSVGIVERLELAAYGSAFYLLKTVAPFHLLPLYARPVRFDAGDPRFLAAIAAVAALGALAFAARKRWPALPAAGTYYLLTLSPVLGLVLSGIYLAADRYSYLPCLAWAVLAGAAAEFARRRAGRAGKAVLLCALGALIAGLTALTRRQCRVWRDSSTLWSYALSVDPNSAAARNNLGTALARAGREAEAAAEFRNALEIDPRDPEAHNNLATALVHQGRLDEAVAEYKEALTALPTYAMARDNLGAVLAAQGKTADAIAEYQLALALNPQDAHARNNLGLALAGAGRVQDAVVDYRKALAISPDFAQAHDNLGLALAGLGRSAEAADEFRRALAIDPNGADAAEHLRALEANGKKLANNQ